jgi:integrase
MKQPYKPAKFYCGASSEWYVEYYYLDPNSKKYERFKERFKIIRVRSSEVEAYAKFYGKEAAKFMNEKLKAGFNPFTAMRKNAQPQIKQTLLELKNAISEIASYHAKTEYNLNYNRIIRFIDDNNLGNLMLCEFTKSHATAYRDQLLKKCKLSATTINSAITYAAMYWDKAIEANYAQVNIFRNITRIKKGRGNELEKERFQPFTTAEMTNIFDCLRRNNQEGFANFLKFIYHAWVRPIEISRLKVKHIQLANDLIKFDKQDTKNDKSALVQIVPPLKEILLQMNLEQYPEEYYLFSTFSFSPGPKKMDRNVWQRRWTRWVKGELGIQKDMYGLKHTGNIDWLLNNKDNPNTKWQQMQNRHCSSLMTERYIKRLGAYFVDTSKMKFNKFE